MRNLILFDDESRESLLPLSYTRPVCELRVGILSLREKWEILLNGKASHITNEYLSPKYLINIEADNIVINGAVLPNQQLVKLINGLAQNEAIMNEGDLVAARIPGDEFDSLIDGTFGEEISGYALSETPARKLKSCTDIFTLCGEEIASDFRMLTASRNSAALSPTNNRIGSHEVFLEEGATAEFATFNTEAGPIYLGKDCHVMEGSILKGPCSIGRGAIVKMGAKIYGATSIGPHCKVGGEVNNVSMQSYSNKGHEGFLGSSAIGEWCNLGADTNNSNLKNTYTDVRMWDYSTEKFEETGLMFCGLVMGDHSKCGINTMFNTGTVVGVNANIYGSGYPRNFIPSFSWGGPQGMRTFQLEKAFETARAMMARRNQTLTEKDENILSAVFEISERFRSWEK